MEKEKNNTPNVAPGLDDQDELNEKATRDEVEHGEYTKVTRLSFDEVGPSD